MMTWRPEGISVNKPIIHCRTKRRRGNCYCPRHGKLCGFAMLGEEEKAAEKMGEITVFSRSGLEALHNSGVV